MTRKGSSAASSPSAALNNGVAGTGRFICSMCAKVYRSGAGLRYHKRKRHRGRQMLEYLLCLFFSVGEGMVEPTALHRVKCQEPGCTYQMLAISDLRNHLSNHHQKPEYKCTEEKKFTSLADFTEWKSSFESRTGSKYVKNCGAKGKSDNQTTEYYYCNRTGPYKIIVGQGLRRSKAQGSLRCGIHCTSSMKVEIQNDEHITVQYYPAHYGHSHLSAADELHLSENSMTMGGINGNSSSTINNGHHQQQQQQQQHQQQDNEQSVLTHYPSHSGDCSSSSSPGSSSTSPSGGSNSNSNHPPSSSMISCTDRQSITTSNTLIKNSNNISNNHNSLQNQMSHCIIISPSFVLEENASTHSNHHSTPVLIVQQQQQQQQMNQYLPPSSTTIVAPTTNLTIKKEKCVSDIMREAFQLLSYWPLDHHHSLVTTENEQQFSHSHVNMDEHLMF
ncbi:unnamed protein product [Adineta steineri]|uniref:C2H2-type domain-containing protein n=2 Tax=Bdelloidea TaxID=44578 RepID=A0A815BH76_9BILA|nr:unnamed protein product [Adineta steineri]CAF3637094.1 unnamed protein product [Adineta steineri]